MAVENHTGHGVTEKIIVTPLHTKDVSVGFDQLANLSSEPQLVLSKLALIRKLFEQWSNNTNISFSQQKIPVNDARFQTSNNGLLEIIVDTKGYNYIITLDEADFYSIDGTHVTFNLGYAKPEVNINQSDRFVGFPHSKGSGTYHIYRGVQEFRGKIDPELQNGLDIKVVPNIKLGEGDIFMFRIGRSVDRVDEAIRNTMVQILQSSEGNNYDVFVSGNEATSLEGIQQIIGTASTSTITILATPNKWILGSEIMKELEHKAGYISMNHEELFDYCNLNHTDKLDIIGSYRRGDLDHKLKLIHASYIQSFPDRRGNTIITMEGDGACCIGYDNNNIATIVHMNVVDDQQNLLNTIETICSRHNKTISPYIDHQIENSTGSGDSVMMGIAQKRQDQEIYNILEIYPAVGSKTKELLVDGVTAQLFGYLTYHCAYTNIFQLKDEDKLGEKCFKECIQAIKTYYHESINQILSDYSKSQI